MNTPGPEARAAAETVFNNPDSPTHALLDVPTLDRMEALELPRHHRKGSGR